MPNMDVNISVPERTSLSGSESDVKGVYIFDFDGTVTTDDTFALFLKHFAGPIGWLWRIILLLPTFITYKLDLISRDEVKIRVIRRFFKNTSAELLILKQKNSQVILYLT